MPVQDHLNQEDPKAPTSRKFTLLGGKRLWDSWFDGAERRSGKERRGSRSERLRHQLYRTIFRIKPHYAVLDPVAVPPEPVVSFTDTQRVEILLSLHNNIRENIQQWENRIFQVFLLSEGAILSAVAFCLQHPLFEKGLVSGAFGIFGTAALVYLFLAVKAHANNGVLLVKIEAALGLCQKGAYIKNAPFFGYSGIWVQDWRTPILLLFHLLTVGFAVYVISHAAGVSPTERNTKDGPGPADGSKNLTYIVRPALPSPRLAREARTT